MAMIVTPLPPVSTVKIALAMMQTMARPAGHPSEHRLGGVDEAVGRLRLRQHVADEREERDRDDDRRVREALVEHRGRDEAQVVVRRVGMQHPQDLGRAAHDAEERHAEQREEDHARRDDAPEDAEAGDADARRRPGRSSRPARAGRPLPEGCSCRSAPPRPPVTLLGAHAARLPPARPLGSRRMLPESRIAIRKRNFRAIIRRPNGKMRSSSRTRSPRAAPPLPGTSTAGMCVAPGALGVHLLRVDRRLVEVTRPVGAVEPVVPRRRRSSTSRTTCPRARAAASGCRATPAAPGGRSPKPSPWRRLASLSLTGASQTAVESAGQGTVAVAWYWAIAM